MRLTSWNFLHGLATPLTDMTDTDLPGVINTLNPDILGLQEVDYLLSRSNGANQVAHIAGLMGTKHWAFAPSVIGSPDEDWRPPTHTDSAVVTVSTPGPPGYGIGLISKFPVISWHRLELRAAPIGIFMKLPRDGAFKRMYVHDHPRTALAAVIGDGWLVINSHLSFVPFFNYLQLLQVKRWARHLPVIDKKKIIIMGDFNLRWSLLVRGFNWNSLAAKPTFPTWSPKAQIDYILSQKIASEDVVSIETPPLGISDHLPITVDIDQ